jgi:hypothetical protein
MSGPPPFPADRSLRKWFRTVNNNPRENNLALVVARLKNFLTEYSKLPESFLIDELDKAILSDPSVAM